MIDITRSLGVFDPASYKDDIHIIGVGATGSHVCEGLILQGINGTQIHVYDPDVIEEHNIANQLYTYSDIGKPKVEALGERIYKDYNESIHIHKEKVHDSSKFTGIVFLLVDQSREKIFKSLKFKPAIKLVIETGLDARFGRVVTIDPRNINHNKYFEKNFLFNTKEDSAEVSVCGTRQVVAQTVSILSAMAIWEFMKWANDPMRIGNFICFATEPWFVQEEKIS